MNKRKRTNKTLHRKLITGQREPPLKHGGELMWSVRVSSSYSTMTTVVLLLKDTNIISFLNRAEHQCT